jgi:hypothetical protein
MSSVTVSPMQLLSAFVLGYFAVFGELGSALDQGGQAHVARRAISGPAVALLSKAADPKLTRAEAAPRFDSPLDQPQRRVTRGSRVFYLPGGCRSVSAPYDLVLHFHGAPPSVEASFERSGIDAALVVVNLGIGSGPYEDAFVMPGAFEQFLSRTQDVISEMCPTAAHSVKRIALSGWSAGYGAIWRILERNASDDRIDAVLLADGLHGGFDGPPRLRQVASPQMEPFAVFSEQAARGERLMAITHSAIVTEGYASTTETADYLISDNGLLRTRLHSQGPRSDMLLTSRVDSGCLHIEGYAGDGKAAHCDQLHALGDTLLPRLAARWAR